MSSINGDTDQVCRLDRRADELLELAQVLRGASGAPDGPATTPVVLRRLERALQSLSASWYEIAADAAAASRERGRATERPSSLVDAPSRPQDAHPMATLHDVGAAFARCARSCREGPLAVAPLLAEPSPPRHRADLGGPVTRAPRQASMR